jgi:hypothetical protein
LPVASTIDNEPSSESAAIEPLDASGWVEVVLEPLGDALAARDGEGLTPSPDGDDDAVPDGLGPAHAHTTVATATITPDRNPRRGLIA